MLGNLDMTDERDRGLLRRRVSDPTNKRRRWGEITEEFKSDAVRALKYALRLATEKQDARGIRGIVQTLGMLEGQNQADEHLAEKYERLDNDKPTENVQHVRRVVLQIDGQG